MVNLTHIQVLIYLLPAVAEVVRQLVVVVALEVI
jgi:hypothetical protein